MKRRGYLDIADDPPAANRPRKGAAQLKPALIVVIGDTCPH